jgi:hypothetical protein
VISAYYNSYQPSISARDFFTRNSVFNKFFKTAEILEQLGKHQNLRPAGIGILKEKDKIVFQQMSIDALVLLRFFQHLTNGMTDKIILEKPIPQLSLGINVVHPHLSTQNISAETYFKIAGNYLNTPKADLENAIADLKDKSDTIKMYAIRDYYRDAYAIYEYCEIQLKIRFGLANANAADKYAARTVDSATILDENLRIQKYDIQIKFVNTMDMLTSESSEEDQKLVSEPTLEEVIDVATHFFNSEVLIYNSENNMKISETDPLRAIRLHCESHTDIQLSALFLLKCIDVYAGKLLNKTPSPEAETLLRLFFENKIPDAEIVYETNEDNPIKNVYLNLLPAGSTPLIMNKIKLTLRFEVIIMYLVKILDEPEKHSGLLQNLFEQTQDILISHNAEYKTFYIKELDADGKIIKPLNIPDLIQKSPSKRLYPVTPKPIRMQVDPGMITGRINYLKSHLVFAHFFNVQFFTSEMASLNKLSLEEAFAKETLIYANIMLSAAYLLRYLNNATKGDLARICGYSSPPIFKLWDEEPHLIDQKAVILLNIPALENQIDILKKECTKTFLHKIRDYYRGADSLCRFTQIILRQFKCQTRERELADFMSETSILTLHVLEEENDKIYKVARQRDTNAQKAGNKKEIVNAYRASDQIDPNKINVTTAFFNQNRMHRNIDNTINIALRNNGSESATALKLEAEIYTMSILSSLFLMKLLNYLSGNTILNTSYKAKEDETLYYFSAYLIPDAYFAPAQKDIPQRIVFAIPSEMNYVNLIVSALNMNAIAAEIARILQLPKAEARNAEFSFLYDQAAKLFHDFDMHYKTKTSPDGREFHADDSILKPVYYKPVLTLSHFPMPELNVEKKKEKKITKSEAKSATTDVEDKSHEEQNKKKEKPQPKILSASEITINSINNFASAAKIHYAQIPLLLTTANKNFAELQSRNAKSVIPKDLNKTDPKLFREMTDCQSHIVALGESIDTLTAHHKNFIIPTISDSKILSELEINKEIHKKSSEAMEKLFEKVTSLDGIISNLGDRTDKIVQKLEHRESDHAITPASTVTIKQKLQSKQQQKDAERKAAADLKKKLDDERKTREPKEKKKLTPPSMAPVAALPAKTVKLFSPPSAKEHKQASTYDPMRKRRELYMDEACQSLIFINTLLEHYRGLDADMMHHSLLYNIFRCFMALKSYQECGGRESQELSVDTIKELRHMIIHHGGRAVDNAQVLDFAEDIRGKIPSALLKLKKPHLWKSELNDKQRNQLMEGFGLMPSGLEKLRNPDPFSKVIDDTPFYKQLRHFHEDKIDNEVGLEDRDLVLTIYIPLMKSIIETFKKQKDYKTNGNLFLQSYLFPLQALSMLATLCGEVSIGFPVLTYELTEFLSECYMIRNEVGHELYDLERLTLFARSIENKISLVYERKILEKISQPVAAASTPTRKIG